MLIFGSVENHRLEDDFPFELVIFEIQPLIFSQFLNQCNGPIGSSMGIINCSGKKSVWMYPCTRWVPSSFRWNYNPYKWPYTWITPVSGCIHGTLPSFSPRQKNPFPKTLFESAGPQELCYYAKLDLNPSQCPLSRSMIFFVLGAQGVEKFGNQKMVGDYLK